MKVPLAMLTLLTACAGLRAAREASAEADAVEARIRAGIEAHRKGDFVVRVVDADGRPVAGAAVEVEMTRHAFGFGTCVRSDRLARRADEPDTERYREWIVSLFNRATLGNGHKWGWQARPDRRTDADAATAWLRDQGLDVHGHTMIWDSVKWKPFPKDVLDLVTGDAPGRAAALRDRSLAHILDVGRRYRGRVVSWDVVNEPTSEHAIQDVVCPDAPRGQAPILVDWYRAARQADPEAVLYVNDFHVLVGDHATHKDSYEGTIRFLLDRGAPLGGIGFQCHYYNANTTRTADQLFETLDRFAAFGLPFHISEFDTFGKGWGDARDVRERRQAEALRTVLRVFFSHPRATAFTMWGFWDGQHWHGEAPLFRKDWTPKPALEVYRDLVFDRWWTRASGTTASDGTFAFRGVFGDYRVRAARGTGAGETAAVLREDGAAARVTLAEVAARRDPASRP